MTSKQKSLLSRLCAAVLALLGFASCQEIIGNFRDEYGSPTMDYKIIGTVSDEEGNAISNIRVTTSDRDTLFSNEKGKYETRIFERRYFFPSLVFEDIDGDANGGTFLSDSVSKQEVWESPRKQLQKGDGNWYKGTYEYTVDVTLKKQEKIED